MARALTLIKPCLAEAQIPIHPNVGMGVGGVPMFVHPPVDAVCRAAKAFVDILKVDGL
jgi:dimethylamine--corrinoid protein Co-methyltransferase